MAEVKAVFFDFDWTLFDHKTRSFVPSATRAIKAAHGQGVRIFINSARSYYALRELGTFERIDFDGFVVNNGGAAFTKEEILYAKFLPPSLVEDLLRTAKEQKVSYLLVTLKEAYLSSFPDDPNVNSFYAVYYEPRPRPISEYRGEPVLAIQLFMKEEKDPCFIKRVGITFNRFFETAAEITSEPFRKSDGIKALIANTGLANDELAAFGDDTNDIDMFNLVGHGICMGNGVKEAKEKASWVTTSIEEDGIENGLIHLGIIER